MTVVRCSVKGVDEVNWQERAEIGLLRTQNLDRHFVRVYSDRLAIWRRDGQRMTWEELQTVKQEIWGDAVAVEVYPAESDVVNLRHTRHLWHTPELAVVVAAVCTHKEFESC